MAKTASGEREHEAMFGWLPAHRIHRSEQQSRAQDLLGRIPLFGAVPPYRLRAIAQMTRRNRYDAGEVIIRVGDIGSTMHVVRSGRVHVLREAQKAEPILLATLGPGEFFGELALFDREPRSATVVAAEKTETLSLSRFEILEIIGRYPEVALAFLSSIGARLRAADNLLENITHPSNGGAKPKRSPRKAPRRISR
jgi:CRP/FNR family transcriptional regulator/CRP/FNR family cyclic AMP-dependent transcriptional regulator